MSTHKLCEQLMGLVYLIDPKCNSVTINDSLEDILNVLHTYIQYQKYDIDCLIKERDYYQKRLLD